MPKTDLVVTSGFYDTRTPFGQSLPENLVTIQRQGAAIQDQYVVQQRSLQPIDSINLPTGNLRGWCFHKGDLYAYIGTDLYRYDGSWVLITISYAEPPIAELTTQPVKMVSNGLVICALGIGSGSGAEDDYYIDTDTVPAVGVRINTRTGGVYDTLTNGQGATDVTFFDDYFVFVSAEASTIFHGTLPTVMDGTDINGTDFQKIYAQRDELTALFQINGQLAACSSNHIDFFQNVGSDNFAFQLLKGQTFSLGVANRSAWTQIGDDVMFYGKSEDGFLGVYTVKQGKISNDAVDSIVNGVANSEDTSYCMSYSLDGQLFGVITTTGNQFDINDPDGFSYSYNFTNKTWAKRSTRSVRDGFPDVSTSYIWWPKDAFLLDDTLYFIGYFDRQFGSYNKNYLASTDSNYLGDFGTGTYDPNIYECTTQILEDIGEGIIVNEVGIYSQGMEGQVVELSYSDDDLENFTSLGEITVSDIGIPLRPLVEWRRLGYTNKARVYKFSFGARTLNEGTPYQILKPYMKWEPAGA
jgi:hypothetical protein